MKISAKNNSNLNIGVLHVIGPNNNSPVNESVMLYSKFAMPLASIDEKFATEQGGLAQSADETWQTGSLGASVGLQP